MAEGSIRKKAGRYYATTREKRADGTYGQRGHGGFRTKREAESALRAVLEAKGRGQYVEPSKLTVGEWMTTWLRLHSRNVRATTAEAYERNLRNHVLPGIGSVPLQKLTATKLDVLYERLLTDGRRDGKGLAAKTVINLHVMIHEALGTAVKKGVLLANPADNATRPRSTAHHSGVTWTGPQVRLLLDRLQSDRLYAAYLLAASTGMRRGEVLGLQWASVQLDAGTLAVRRGLVMVGGEFVYSPPKTAQGRRSVDLDPVTVAALRAQRVRQAQERLAVGAGWHDGDLVFCKEDGGPLRPDVFSQSFLRHAKAAGLPRIRLHDLRHTHATLALQAGVDIKVVSGRLGHAKASFTADVYQHVMPGMQAEAASKVAALIWPTGS